MNIERVGNSNLWLQSLKIPVSEKNRPNSQTSEHNFLCSPKNLMLLNEVLNYYHQDQNGWQIRAVIRISKLWVQMFQIISKKLKKKGTFVQKSRVQNQISWKSVCAEICGCSCTHCTHTNEDPASETTPRVGITWSPSYPNRESEQFMLYLPSFSSFASKMSRQSNKSSFAFAHKYFWHRCPPPRTEPKDNYNPHFLLPLYIWHSKMWHFEKPVSYPVWK